MKGLKPLQIKDTVIFGDYKEVDGVEAKTITKDDADNRVLNGLIISGYETKFSDAKNTNGEVYVKGCLNDCIENYFVKNKLNIPCDVFHLTDIDHAAGVVLILEENSVGFYFTVYIPKTYCNYDKLLNLIKIGYVQGFSKYGWATDYEYKYLSNGDFSHIEIKKMDLYRVSLVDVPANAVPFENVKEVSNATKFIKEPKKGLKSILK